MSDDIRKMVQDVQDRIREVAYLMWESAGRQHGMATEYWFAAEREVVATMEAASERMMPSPAEKTEATSFQSEAKAPKETAPTTQPTARKTGYKIEQIEGVGPAYAAKLATAGIETTGDLLDRCGSPQGRQKAAEKTGISAGQLLKWAKMADLMRISGIGGEYAELLEATGVDTLKGLRSSAAETLAAKMANVNAGKKLTRRVASAKQVAKWVDQAQVLDAMITH